MAVPISSEISRLRTNWDLSPHSPILPTNLQASGPSSYSPHLINALTQLSDLTCGEKKRAWDLLNTYFQARLREAAYRGTYEGIYAELRVEDVQKAIGSEQKMIGGRKIQRRNSISMPIDDSKEEGLELETGKLKYSIHHELFSTKPSSHTSKKKKIPPSLPSIQDMLATSSTLSPKLKRKLAPHPALPPISTSDQLPFRNALIHRASQRLNLARVNLSHAQTAYLWAQETFDRLNSDTST
jgi:hypothetical protein